MTMRYAHLTPAVKEDAVEALVPAPKKGGARHDQGTISRLDDYRRARKPYEIDQFCNTKKAEHRLGPTGGDRN